MKAMWMRIVSITLCFAGACGMAGDLALRYEHAGVYLYLSFDSQTATNYQFQISTNLSDWANFGSVIAGDGLSRTQVVSTAEQPTAFFRVEATGTSPEVAPSVEEFTRIAVGQTVLGYAFVDSTRFNWFGEWGNWDYSKTGSTMGKLVFTYDEDDNEPGIYREEVVLTFQIPTQGTFRYSEYYFGVEAPGSVTTGPFDFGGP